VVTRAPLAGIPGTRRLEGLWKHVGLHPAQGGESTWHVLYCCLPRTIHADDDLPRITVHQCCGYVGRLFLVGPVSADLSPLCVCVRSVQGLCCWGCRRVMRPAVISIITT